MIRITILKVDVTKNSIINMIKLFRVGKNKKFNIKEVVSQSGIYKLTLYNDPGRSLNLWIKENVIWVGGLNKFMSCLLLSRKITFSVMGYRNFEDEGKAREAFLSS